MLHAIVADGVQVFDHAHVVFGTVALIEVFQAVAWIIGTFKTKANLAFAKQLAAVCHVDAILSAGNAARAVGAVKTSFVQVQLLEMVGGA